VKTVLIIFLLCSSFLFTQQPTLQWARTYNGPLNLADRGVAIVVDDSGYVYVTGTLKGTLTNDFDYCTIKYKPNGDTSWVRIYSRADSLLSGQEVITDREVFRLTIGQMQLLLMIQGMFM